MAEQVTAETSVITLEEPLIRTDSIGRIRRPDGSMATKDEAAQIAAHTDLINTEAPEALIKVDGLGRIRRPNGSMATKHEAEQIVTHADLINSERPDVAHNLSLNGGDPVSHEGEEPKKALLDRWDEKYTFPAKAALSRFGRRLTRKGEAQSTEAVVAEETPSEDLAPTEEMPLPVNSVRNYDPEQAKQALAVAKSVEYGVRSDGSKRRGLEISEDGAVVPLETFVGRTVTVKTKDGKEFYTMRGVADGDELVDLDESDIEGQLRFLDRGENGTYPPVVIGQNWKVNGREVGEIEAVEVADALTATDIEEGPEDICTNTEKEFVFVFNKIADRMMEQAAAEMQEPIEDGSEKTLRKRARRMMGNAWSKLKDMPTRALVAGQAGAESLRGDEDADNRRKYIIAGVGGVLLASATAYVSLKSGGSPSSGGAQHAVEAMPSGAGAAHTDPSSLGFTAFPGMSSAPKVHQHATEAVSGVIAGPPAPAGANHAHAVAEAASGVTAGQIETAGPLDFTALPGMPDASKAHQAHEAAQTVASGVAGNEVAEHGRDMTLRHDHTIWDDEQRIIANNNPGISPEELQARTQEAVNGTLSADGITYPEARELPDNFRYNIPQPVLEEMLKNS